jgi:hypothetical protein
VKKYFFSISSIAMFLIGLMSFSFVLGAIASADVYECDDPSGCPAIHADATGVINSTVPYGNCVATERGWIINPIDGWRQVDCWHYAAGPSGVGVPPPSRMDIQCVAESGYVCAVLSYWGDSIEVPPGSICAYPYPYTVLHGNWIVL